MSLKHRKIMGWYIENRIFYFYSILLILYLTLTGIPVLSRGFNRTVGWKWTLTSVDFIITYYTLVIYFFGLLILLILNRRTDKKLSVFFLISMCLIFIYDSLFGFNYCLF